MPSAMENNGKSSGMDEAHLLLPWYVTGKLEDAEAKELEALAREDAEFAKLIAEARAESQETVSINEAAGGPSASVWARIEATVEQEKRAQSSLRLPARVQSVKTSISSFFAGLGVPQWQAVAAAAVAVCVIQAGALFYLAGGDHGTSNYRTASGPGAQVGAKPSVFIVSFSDSASIGEISKALDDAGAVIVEGPNDDMLYHIGLRDDTVAAKDRAYAKLQTSGLVKLILPEK
ncbi:MAG: hypothetical protein ACLPPF_01360 [Rhodomicrobium sp.]